jgi:hypothetical protein
VHLEDDSRGKIIRNMAPIARVARRGTDSRRVQMAMQRKPDTEYQPKEETCKGHGHGDGDGVEDSFPCKEGWTKCRGRDMMGMIRELSRANTSHSHD